MSGSFGLRLIGLACVALGTLGLVVPLLPGPVLIWAGAAAYAVGDRFSEVGWPTVVTLGALALSAEIADLAITSWAARRGGVPFKSVLAAFLGSMAGALVASLPGGVLGAIGGLVFAEYVRLDGDWPRIRASSQLVIAAYLAAVAVQIVLGFAMLGIFLWQAFPVS